MDLKEITNKLLDGMVNIGDDESPVLVSKREAMLMRIVQDAIADEDPAIRVKSAAIILDLIDFKAEKGRAKIVNKKGKSI